MYNFVCSTFLCTTECRYILFQAGDSTIETLKEKLIKKTQLLEKAKILLSRAAAKEKNFREQVKY